MIHDYRGKLPVRPGAAYTRRNAAVDTAVIHWADATGLDWHPWEIARYQTGPGAHLAFPAIAYHYQVTQAGVLYILHDVATSTWHAGEWNDRSLGILVCPEPDGLFTDAQAEATRGLLTLLRQFIPHLSVVGHREVRPTACPGPRWAENKRMLEG